MKKLLPLIFTFCLFTFNTNAQCTPDPLYFDSIYGAWPDTVTNFVSGQVGVSYVQILDFKLPLDAGDIDPQYVGIPVDSAVLTDVTGLPPGLNYTCNTPSCTWYGGDQGCASLDGTPTTSGTYDITITLDGWVTFLFTPISQVLTFTGYVIDINPAGIETIKLTDKTFILKQNFPNPTNGDTRIQFVTGNKENVEFSVLNLLGDVVESNTISTKRGVNTIDLDLNSYPDGIYLYSISNGKNKLTKRMIVNH